jgi:hypothetical protein
MIVCETPVFSSWRPNFESSGLASPSWTRMVVGGVELVNSVEWIDWHDDDEPGVQVLICEACGTVRCKGGDWVRIVRLGSSLLWVPAWIEDPDDWRANEYRSPGYLRGHGAVMVRVDDWNYWRSSYSALPDASVFPPATRRDIASAWLLESPIRAETMGQLREHVLPEILAGSRLDRDDAIHAVDAVANWLDQPAGEEPVTGYELRQPEDASSIETIYVDGLPEWQPIACDNDRLGPAFGGGVVLEPRPLAR